jgi:hypothetical protein
MAGWRESDLQEDVGKGSISMNVSAEKAPAWSGILRRTYRLYWERFGAFFRIGLPPALVAYLYQFLHRAVVSKLRASGLAPPHSFGAWTLVIAFTLIEGAVYWIISGFLFAAVAANVLHETPTGESLVAEQSSIADDFSMARKRLGPVFIVTLLIWAMFVLGRGVSAFLMVTLLDHLRLLQNLTVTVIAIAVPLLLVAGLLSRLGLAIPVLIAGPAVSVSQAIRKSFEETENWEPFFMAFLAKSALMGYGAYWVVQLGLAWLWQHSSIDLMSYTWGQGIVYVSIAAILEPPLFIAFSLLYRDLQLMQEEALPAAVG